MTTAPLRRRTTAAVVSAALALLAVPLGVGGLASATAADATTAALPPTVSADALPTVQINGVVWAQLVVGNTVYVAGQFTSARPSGSPAGTNETPRSNLLAYDITTGALVTAWAPTTNGAALTLAASPDGSRIYVGGSFTTVNGSTRSRLAALDAKTGALVSGFAPTFSTTVRALTTIGGTLYAGGDFNAVNGQARAKLAAVDATGALLGWAPQANAPVYALTAPGSVAEVVAAGRFSTLNGTTMLGSGALDPTTGATLPWAVQSQVNDYGDSAAIYSLSTDGTAVFGTGYNFSGSGNLENSFAAEANGGALRWANGCLGDTYSSTPLGGVLYTVGHAHDCSAIGGKPERTPRDNQYAQATTIAASGQVNGANAYGWSTRGLPAPTLLHWQPTFTNGTYTGQGQATWSLASNAQYVVAAGEFLTVNGTAQQGLTRFAVRTAAPNKQGPQTSSLLVPSVAATYPGSVRASFTATWDRDDDVLTYELLRGGSTTAVVVASTTASSQWWDRPQLGLVDTTAPAGTQQTYRVRVTDPSGNTVTSGATTASIPAAGATSAYADAVRADGATSFWRLGDTTPTAGTASIGANDLRVDTTSTRGATGATADGDRATTFPGIASTPSSASDPNSPTRPVVPATTTALTTPTSSVSIEAWFSTTTTAGGKIVGFGGSQSGDSGVYDDNIYMTNDGRLVYGTYDGAVHTVASSAAVNDGKWHHVVATAAGGVGTLYVDGVRVARQGSGFTPFPAPGYWRIGGDNLGGWPNRPTSGAFAGSIDEVAIYPAALTAAQVTAHYAASSRTPSTAAAPTDAYGRAVVASDPDSYWRLEDAAGSTSVADTSGSGLTGLVAGGTTLGATGRAGTRGAAFDGVDGTVAQSSTQQAPGVYSTELWFSTTTARGGKLIGFGDARSGLSSNYDRQVWMQDSGRLSFGTYTGAFNLATSAKSYNDGAWHHVVATQGADGTKLYVDGQLVASTTVTTAQSFTGAWRVGGDNLNSWPGASTSAFFSGTIDEVATYSSVLDAKAVAAHFAAGGGRAAPVATFTATPGAAGPTASFDGTASSDVDGTVTAWAWAFGDGSTGAGATTSHTYAAAGTYAVSLTVTDDSGLTTTTTQQVKVTATRPAAPTDAYGAAVWAGAPDLYWRLGESSGTVAANSSQNGTDTGTYLHGPVLGAAGIGGGTAATFDGRDDQVISTTTQTGPTTYSEELWFSTTTTRGGKLIGFGDSTDGLSSNYDRHVWLQDDGSLAFGVWTGRSNTITSRAGLNDGKWHHVVATQGSDGMKLYVDGALAGTDPQTQAQAYPGSWRIGGDRSWNSTSDYFAGTLDEVAVYPTVLSAAAVSDHFAKGSASLNKAPVASFTSAVSNLVVAFDASASKDEDGSLASYAWDFGDGSTATGAKPSRTYAAAGTYQVKLTVTDDKGATGTVTQSVTTTGAVLVPGALAQDVFNRTTATGLGTADTGGAWTTTGGASNFSVSSGTASVVLAAPGSTSAAQLNAVSSSATAVQVSFALDKAATGGGVYTSLVGRRVGSSDYRLKAQVTSSGSVNLYLVRFTGGVETTLKQAALSGVTVTPGQRVNLKLVVSGTGTTTLAGTAWLDGTAQPAAPQLQTADSTAALQAAGSVGVMGYLSGSSTNSPVTIAVKGLLATTP